MRSLFANTPSIGDYSHGRDNNFNLIRMAAAFGVLLSHAYPLTLGPDTLEPFEVFLKGDNLGRASVFVFFAISGYFITKSFETTPRFSAFVWSRVLRLFPALIVMTVLTVVVGGLFITTDPAFWSVAPVWAYHIITLDWLVLAGGPELPGMFLSNPYPGAVNGSLWTLRFEVLCYVGVGIAGLLGIFKRRVLFLSLVLGFVVLSLVVPMVTQRYILNILLYIAGPFVFGAAFYVFRDKIPLSIWIALALSVSSSCYVQHCYSCPHLCWRFPIGSFCSGSQTFRS